MGLLFNLCIRIKLVSKLWGVTSMQCSTHSTYGNILGLSPLWENWVSVCILPRPISVSKGTGLMGWLSIATPTLVDPSTCFSRSLLQRLPLTSNSKSLTNLRKCSSSSSLLSKRSCPKAPDIDRYVWSDPSPRPEWSSSCSYLWSSSLLCLISRQLKPYENPPEPLSL